MSVFNPFCESRKLIRDGGAGYTDKGKTVLTLGLKNGAAQIEATSDVLEYGKTYTIRTDSGEYTEKCMHSSQYGADVKHIGNPGLILQGLMTNNGLPYGVVYVNNTNPEMGEVGTFYGAADTNGGSNITVSTTDIVHPIEPKYLPEPVKINLADYDIDIVSAALAGGGSWVVYRPDFWDVVHANSNRDIRFIANLNGVDYQLFPSVISVDESDLYGNMAMNLLACMNNIIVNANVCFIHYVDEGNELIGVKCCVTVTQTPIPT